MNKLTATLFTGAVFLASSSLAHATVTLSLEPSASMVQYGGSVSLNLVVSGLGNHAPPSLSLFDVDVSYDAALFGFGGVTFGGYLGDVSVGDTETNVDASAPGTVNLSALSWLEANASTCISCVPPYLEDLQPPSFILANLSFTGLQAGTGAFGLTANTFGDGVGDALPVSLGGSPTITVPAPATVWLLLTGLPLLAGRRRR